MRDPARSNRDLMGRREFCRAQVLQHPVAHPPRRAPVFDDSEMIEKSG
jgi:hypothetical protein